MSPRRDVPREAGGMSPGRDVPGEAGGTSPGRDVPGEAGGMSKAWSKPSESPGMSGTSSLHGIAVAQQRVGRIRPRARSLAFLGLPAQKANAGDRWARAGLGPRGNPKATAALPGTAMVGSSIQIGVSSFKPWKNASSGQSCHGAMGGRDVSFQPLVPLAASSRLARG